VRIRIALTTAVAVIVSTGAFFLLLGSSPAESSARFSTHHVVQHTSKHIRLGNFELAFFAVPTTIAVAQAPATATTTTTPPAPTPAPVVVPAPTPAPAPVVSDASSVYTADWMCIRIHESGNVYNNPAEPSGAYGILDSTWHAFGFSGWPYQAAPIVQDALALRLYNMYGWQPWSSRFACGL
jgi:hypothetical protein